MAASSCWLVGSTINPFCKGTRSKLQHSGGKHVEGSDQARLVPTRKQITWLASERKIETHQNLGVATGHNLCANPM